MGEEIHLLADGCVALLQSVFGESNWFRWNGVKQQAQMENNTQGFIAWLLDLAEQDINRSYGDHHAGSVASSSMTAAAAAVTEVSKLESGGGGGGSQWHGVAGYHPEHHDEEESEEITDVTQFVKREEEGVAGDMYSSGSGIDGGAAMAGLAPQTFPAAGGVESAEQSAAGEYVEIVMPGKDQYHCSHCQVSLSDMLVVEQHITLRHPRATLMLTCFCCSQHFNSIEDYVNYHKVNATNSADSRNRHVCSFCAKSFGTRNRLEDHISSKHDKTGPKYECSICHKRFTRGDNKNAHERRCMANSFVKYV